MKLKRYLQLVTLALMLPMLLLLSAPALAATLPNLGTAASFGVLANTMVTNTGTTHVIGDVGVSPGTAVTGFPPGTLTGSIHAGDSVAQLAQNDVTAAWNATIGQPCDTNLSGQDLGGKTLTTAVYCFNSSAQLTGQLTLDGQGNFASVFIFQIGSTFTTASNASVLLINGAQACNIFWQVGSSATLGTNTNFKGNIMALASITLNTTASSTGGLYARTGAVTLETNNIQACGRPTATNTPLPTATNTPVPTATNTPAPTQTPGGPTATLMPTATNTPLPTATNTPLPTQTPGGPTATLVPPSPTSINTPMPTNTITLTATNTPQPSNTPGGPSATPTLTATLQPGATNTPTPRRGHVLPTNTAVPQPTSQMTAAPTNTAAPQPTSQMTAAPTNTIAMISTQVVGATDTATATSTSAASITSTPVAVATNTKGSGVTNTATPFATPSSPAVGMPHTGNDLPWASPLMLLLGVLLLTAGLRLSGRGEKRLR